MSMDFTEAELVAIRAEYCKGATDTQFELFISECKARALRPGPHVVFQLRNAKEWDADTGASRFVKKPYWITTIGALRLIALRTGQYGGSTPAEYIYLDDNGDPTVISQIPLPSKTNKSLPREPWAVRISVKRKDFDEPITSIVRFDSVAATQKRDNILVLTDMWQKRGDAQTAKCSEADALRKAFPEELGSLYLSEEIKNEEEPHQAATAPASVVPLPPPVPKVNQEPAKPVEAPRPNEPWRGNASKLQEAEMIPGVKDREKPAVPPVNPELEKALAALPPGTVKPAAELPPPAKKKGGRPKKVESPDNGQPAPVDQGITQADIENAGKPAPAVDEAANKAAAEEFVEALDPTPTKEEQAGFSSRVRALAAAGANTQDLRNYILAVGHKDEPKQLTVANWNDALTRLETALGEGKDKLLEATKNAPLPAF
jgi:hypothetical protein